MHEALSKFHEEKQNATSFATEYRAGNKKKISLNLILQNSFTKKMQYLLDSSASESDILEYLAFSTYQKGELQSAGYYYLP